MGSELGSYAQRYRETINDTSSISGERYEFFIRFRVSLMKRKLIKIGAYDGVGCILDFGCGIGATGEVLEAAFLQATIIGIDPSQESIVEARRLGLRRTEFIRAEGGATTLPENSVDLVYSNGVFHHILPKSRAVVLREIHRVVKPGGHIFIFENNPANPLMMRAMAKSPLDTNAQVLTAGELGSLVKDNGFFLLKTGYYFLFPHFLRFLRWSEPLFEPLPLGAQYFVWAVRQ